MWTIFKVSTEFATEYFFCCMVVVFFFTFEACGILAPRPGIEPVPSALEGGVLTTGLPGKFQGWNFVWENIPVIPGCSINVYRLFFLFLTFKPSYCVHAHIHIDVHTQTHACAQMQMCTHRHTHTDTQTHAHIYTSVSRTNWLWDFCSTSHRLEDFQMITLKQNVNVVALTQFSACICKGQFLLLCECVHEILVV